MKSFVIRIVINGIALVAATYLLPDIRIAYAHGANALPDWVQVGELGLIFGVVNALVKPVVKILSFPVTLMTLGLFTFVINGLMLLVTAAASTHIGTNLVVGGYPPDMTIQAVWAAIVGSVVISVVSTAVGLLLKD